MSDVTGDPPGTNEPSEDGPPGEPDVEQRPELRLTEASTEVSGELRTRRSSFFRARREGTSPVADVEVEAGPRWSEQEAERRIRMFLLRLAGDRPLEHRDDPVDFARENDLLLLFGPDEEESFAKLALRFPEETVAQWATLLAGGDRSEAFGPRSRAERRDEESIEQSIKLGVRKRALTVMAVALVAVIGFIGIRSALEEAPVDRSDRALRFAVTSQNRDLGDPGDPDAPVTGGPPVAEPLLVVGLDRLVAVAVGEGAVEDRIRLRVDEGILPVPSGGVTASVFEHRGGQVALVGPGGWVVAACVRISVVTEILRPLDVVLFDSSERACPVGLEGRPAIATCRGTDALILEIDIPQGEVDLVEGGIGWAEGIRISLEFAAPGWDVLSLRGTIAVPSGAESVAIPRFGGGPGDEVTVDLGEGRTGTCTLG
ncbi:MAG: hypothetical protein P6D49_04835 [Acidimicrobiales bacterium]|nr:hypothetical protein [Acidimicrobiales bacterium]